MENQVKPMGKMEAVTGKAKGFIQRNWKKALKWAAIGTATIGGGILLAGLLGKNDGTTDEAIDQPSLNDGYNDSEVSAEVTYQDETGESSIS